MSHPQKPIVDLSRYWLAKRPSKNYIFHLLHQHIQAIGPQRSLDAGAGELRNFWMFPGKYVGITHNRPAYRRGMKRLTLPQAVADITTPLITGAARAPMVFLMRLESDLSFLEDFDLVVSTNTLPYVENQDDTLRRLSDRVKRGGSLIVDGPATDVDEALTALKDDYENIEIVYHGFGQCDEFFTTMPNRREAMPEPRFMELCHREMTAPNLRDGHTYFYLIAQRKKCDAGRPGVMPELMDDNGLFIVKKDIPYLKMDEPEPAATASTFTGARRGEATRPILHIGPPKTASTTIQEFIIPNLGRPYLIKPPWVKSLTRQPQFEQPTIASDIVISDEEFGRFLSKPPPVIAACLSSIAPNASVIYVRRDARELFRSFYLQSLINNLALMATIVEAGLPVSPLSPDDYFDLALATYRQHSIGVFAMVNWAYVRDAFAKHFEFNVLEYRQLREQPEDFVAAFADLCGCPPPISDIGRINTSGPEHIDAAISGVAIAVDPLILNLYRQYYLNYRLSPERVAFLNTLN